MSEQPPAELDPTIAEFYRLLESEPPMLGVSAHLLAVARTPA
jgi:hypothetical protein